MTILIFIYSIIGVEIRLLPLCYRFLVKKASFIGLIVLKGIILLSLIVIPSLIIKLISLGFKISSIFHETHLIILISFIIKYVWFLILLTEQFILRGLILSLIGLVLEKVFLVILILSLKVGSCHIRGPLSVIIEKCICLIGLVSLLTLIITSLPLVIWKVVLIEHLVLLLILHRLLF